MTWYVVDKREYLACGKALGAAYREIMGRHYPAMTAVEVTALMEDAARVEIEATAVVPAVLLTHLKARAGCTPENRMIRKSEGRRAAPSPRGAPP